MTNFKLELYQIPNAIVAALEKTHNESTFEGNGEITESYLYSDDYRAFEVPIKEYNQIEIFEHSVSVVCRDNGSIDVDLTLSY